MPRYDIWDEGYTATGEYCPPSCIARNVEGDNFQDACIRWWASLGPDAEKNWGTFDADRLTVWGCRLGPSREEVA